MKLPTNYVYKQMSEDKFWLLYNYLKPFNYVQKISLCSFKDVIYKICFQIT